MLYRLNSSNCPMSIRKRALNDQHFPLIKVMMFAFYCLLPFSIAGKIGTIKAIRKYNRSLIG